MPPLVTGREMSLEGHALRWDSHALETITQQVRTGGCSTWVVSLPPKKDLEVQNPVPRDPLGTTESRLHMCSGNSIFSNHIVSLTSQEKCQRKERETDVPPAADTDPDWPWFPNSQLPPLLLSVAYLLTGWKQSYQGSLALFWSQAALKGHFRSSWFPRSGEAVKTSSFAQFWFLPSLPQWLILMMPLYHHLLL